MPIVGYFSKTVLLFAAALALQPLLSRRSALIRQLVLRMVILSVLLLTVLVPVIPAWQLPTPGLFDSALQVTRGALHLSGTVAGEKNGGGIDTVRALTTLWLTGMTVVFLRILLGVSIIRRLVAVAPDGCDKDTLAKVNELAAQFDVRRPVRVVVSSQITMPFAWGIRRPLIMLPLSSSGWSAQRLDLVLRHEMAHIKHHDVFWINVASVVVGLHWFNPLAWLWWRRLQKECEQVCDDRVLLTGVPGVAYAHFLLEHAREVNRQHRLFTAGVAPAHNSFLEGRIMSILNKRRRVATAKKWLPVSFAVLVVSVVVPLSGLTFQG
ncbi:MAG: M56 family metallopeptidase, partial [Candidatus Zixiibacteriota bacterium]